jgi:hypothetical protein
MKPTIYYTVIIGKRACLVKYATSPAYAVKLFPGSFDDPGEASREFKIATPGDPLYLTEKAFDHKIAELAERYKQELARLADWNSGKKVRV